MSYVITADKLIKNLKAIEKAKTLYVMGAFGAPGNDKNKARYKNNHSFNRSKDRQAMIDKATEDTFFFDCVNLIKHILWRDVNEKTFKLDKTRTYGGAGYNCNGVPDVGANTMSNRYFINKSYDFTNIIPGSAVHMDGHIGIYIGNGQVIECTPKWSNGVQITNLGNLGYKTGNYRMWTDWGLLPWVDYSNVEDKKTDIVKPENNPKLYTVKPGDTLWAIARKYGTTPDVIVENNTKNYPRMTRNFICTGWVLEV